VTGKIKKKHVFFTLPAYLAVQALRPGTGGRGFPLQHESRDNGKRFADRDPDIRYRRDHYGRYNTLGIALCNSI
jgi:hypothetical protein